MSRMFAVQFLKAGKPVRRTYVTASSEISAKVAAVRNCAILPSEWDEAEATAL